MTRVGPAALLVIVACGRSRAPHEDAAIAPAPSARDTTAECVAIFDAAHARLAPALAKLGIRETAAQARARAHNVAGLGACGRLSDAQRACLRNPPGRASDCGIEPLFVLYDGAARRDALLGAKLSPEDSATRVAALSGTWLGPAVGRNDAIQWRLAPTGALEVTRTSGQGKRATRHDEPPHELAFVRERQLAFKTGSSTQFVPAFVDGDRIYLSWTAGALAIPIASETEFILDEADRDRWVIRHGDSCELVDPTVGATPLACGFEDDPAPGAKLRRFVYETAGTKRAWELHGGALVHPAMEALTRQSTR